MKKLLSLLISASMAFATIATVANAAINASPKAEITYQEYTKEQADSMAGALGTTFAENEALFLITLNLKDLGSLSLSTKTESDLFGNSVSKYSGLKLVGAEIEVCDEVEFLMNNANGSQIKWGNAAKKANGKGIYLSWAETDAQKSYPSVDTESISTLDAAFVGFVKAVKGTELTFDFSKVAFTRFADSVADSSDQNVAFALTLEPVTLGEAAGGDDEVLSLEIATGEIHPNGTVWACTIANAKEGLAQLNATFKGTKGGVAAEKTVITTKLGDWGGVGATEFNIGINTAKAGVVANEINATITDGTGATATYSASAVDVEAE